MTLDIQPVSRVTLSGSVLTQLRQQIISGGLAPGQQLPSERELCEAFGVGRTTVREALKGLEAAGFVERTGRGLAVRDVTTLASEEIDYAALAARVSVRDVYETRKLIEVQCARLAAELAQEADRDGLERALAEMDAADDRAFQATDIVFHTAVAAAAHNPVLLKVYEGSRHFFFRLPAFWRVFDSSRIAAARRERVAAAKRWHWAIYEAIARRDADAAAEAMFGHLDAVQQDLVGHIQVEDPETGTRQPAGDSGAVSLYAEEPL